MSLIGIIIGLINQLVELLLINKLHNEVRCKFASFLTTTNHIQKLSFKNLNIIFVVLKFDNQWIPNKVNIKITSQRLIFIRIKIFSFHLFLYHTINNMI